MQPIKTYKTLVSYLFAGLLAIFISGCGGGADTPTEVSAPTSPFVENFIGIAANSGAIVAIRVGQTATLDDGNSFADSSEALTYDWSFTHVPDGSNAVLQGTTTATPSFTADVRGVYMIQLLVSAEGITSQRAITTVVATVAPESLTGNFNHLGLSSNCVNCHDGVVRQKSGNFITPKPPNHIATSNTCQTCHTPQEFKLIPFADHQEVFGNCSECHNGVLAIGKSDLHVATEAECDDCHNTTSFFDLNLDGSFDHTGINSGCEGCHNGTVAIGKTPSPVDTPPGNHPDTNVDCVYCHSKVSFLNAYPDHTGPAVAGPGISCDSCHVSDGSGIAQGQSAGHPVTNVDCETCHSITTFKLPGGIFNHALVKSTTQRCDSCHTAGNSIGARVETPTATHQNTTADCGSCHNTETFLNAFIDHNGPDVVGKRCDSCHDGSVAVGKPLTTIFYEHMPTGSPTVKDCADCHVPGTFSTGTYDHLDVNTGAPVVSNCLACHNDVIGVGILPSHIPTAGQDCSVCHGSTLDFAANVTFSHTGFVDNCESCHDGSISTGKPFTHIPTPVGQNCDVCHAVEPAPFKPATNFNHVGISNNCESCHNGRRNNVAAGAIGKNATHIPSQNVCSVCHTDTSIGGFATSTFLATVHPGIITGCEGCHTTKFIINKPALVKTASHLPTTQDCDVCHSNVTFTPSIFDHSGITGNCSSCHDGSVNNVIAGALGKAQATNPHPVTTADCGACHAVGQNFTDGLFDHSGITNNCSSCHGDTPTATPTGPKKNNGHVTTNEDCSVCHVVGTFANARFNHTGIVNNCVACHADPGAIATVKHGIHIPTTQDCSVCHNTTAFSGARFDHQNIDNNCESCHDGAIARGKTPPPNHVPTTGDCVDCHQTTGFKPATFDHIGIVDNCRSCHDGAFAKGKSNNHVPTNQDCGVCHTTNSFSGAGFNHTGIVNNCDSCHGAGIAIGKDAKTNPAHLTTSLDCYLCHSTATFAGGKWIHDNTSVGNCKTCHSPGGGATFFNPNTHLNTAEQCDVCHTTNGWAPATFSHSPTGNYPGDHRTDPGCTGCHKGLIGVDDIGNYRNQFIYRPDCAGCHAGDFESEGDHIGGKNGTVSQNRNCAGSGCHKVSDRKFD